jgi:hypothetical protein
MFNIIIRKGNIKKVNYEQKSNNYYKVIQFEQFKKC